MTMTRFLLNFVPSWITLNFLQVMLTNERDKEKASLTVTHKDSHYLPYTNSTYSALPVPRWLLASHRYVPLSVLLSVVMVNSLPSTIIRSISGSSPPSLDHSTKSGLGNKRQPCLCILRLMALQMLYLLCYISI